MSSILSQRKNFIKLTAIFAVYLFTFLFSEFLVNSRVAEVFDAAVVNAVYAGGLCSTALGFLIYGFFGRRIRQYKSIGLIVLAVFVVSVVIVQFCSIQPVFIAASVLTLMTFGIAGGLVHYLISAASANKNQFGRITGFGIAAATVIQFLIQDVIGISVIERVSIVAGAAVLYILIAKTPKPTQTAPRRGRSPMLGATVFTAAAVVLMTFAFSFTDGMITMLDAKGIINIYSYPRLVYAASSVLAGFIADIRKRQFMPFSAGCAMVLFMLSFLPFSTSRFYQLGTATLYFFSGFYVVYLTVGFMDIAPESNHPELVAGMGRIARSLTAAAAVIPATGIFTAYGTAPVTVIAIFICISLFVLFFASGKLNFSHSTPAAEIGDPPDRLMLWQEKYSLTPRETEIVKKLLVSDEPVPQMAKELFISERVLYRHLSSIYEKTETKSRVGLIIKFHDQ